jgi:hypothetical protein
MLERKRQIKSKEKKLDKTKEKNSGEKHIDRQRTDVFEQIKAATEGLYYISETDAEILPFGGEKAEAASKETILAQTKAPADSQVEERDFAEFFARLTEIQDWFGDEEKETAQKFGQLKELLEKNLRDLKVFKIGKIQLDVYAVGLDAENNLIGIKTKAVET